MQRKASAAWFGRLKEGNGNISTQSGVLKNVEYSFGKRFENIPGTNPEELIAAAHAACFSMALSGELEKSEISADNIRTEAQVSLEKTEAGWTVTRVHLNVTAEAAEMNDAQFQEAAASAKLNCPISRLLNANITLEAHLEKRAAA